MFDLKCVACDEIKFKDKDNNVRIFYRVWFVTAGGGLSWLTSDRSFKPGDTVTVELFSQNTSDSKTNFRLGVRIKS